VNNTYSLFVITSAGTWIRRAIPLPEGVHQNDPDYETKLYPEFAPDYYVKLLAAEANSRVERAGDTIDIDLRYSDDLDLQLAVRPHIPVILL
jgi:hypothetical protein